MSNLNGKKFKSALMHQDTFYDGIGKIRKELNTVHNGLIKECVSLVVDEPFLLVTMVNAGGKNVTLSIPLSNVEHLGPVIE